MSGIFPLPEDPIVEEIRAIAARLEFEKRYRELDRSPAFPWKEFRAMGDAGLLGLSMHPAFGGRGLTLPRVGAALFHLAYLGGTTFSKIALQPEFSSVLADHGSSTLLDAWFRPLVRGQRLIANQVTEPTAGSDAAAIQLSAVRDGDHYLLTGTKSEVAFGLDAHAAIVYAKVPSEGGRGAISAFLVPQDLPGVRRVPGEGDLGERWQRRGSVEYDRVEVPEDHRIGEEGHAFRYVLHELTRERALLAAIYLGVARASFDETVRFVGDRKAFGRPISAQEGVAFPLVEDAARLEAAWQLVLRALGSLEHEEPTATAAAALAKWMAAEVALQAIDHAIQFHGGRGYSQSLVHEQRWRDVRSGKIAHGTTEIMRLVAARHLWPTRTDQSSHASTPGASSAARASVDADPSRPSQL
ncbi:MAG TPA: acyl-CoA dehydrogenase [Thermoplasmata archaeon]|nr:acyl-CoA dehydrogenase [Thermoplasmata archaeon]